MRSKVLRHLTVLFLLLTMLISPASFAYASSYSDVTSTPYQAAVETLSDMGIIGGYPDGTYQPSKSVTRAEFSAMITKYLKAGDSVLAAYKATKFKDMKGYGWAIPYIEYCSEKGIIDGDGKGNAMPGNTITYDQAVTMLVRMLGLEPELSSSLKWPANYIEVASKHGLTDNVKASSGNINRGNAALLLYNALSKDSSYTGALSISNLSLYKASGVNEIYTSKFARNLDREIIVKFTLAHDLLETDKILPVQILISPAIEKKVIENETKYIKLLANTKSTEIATSISIRNLVADNLSVNDYKIEIKANNTVLDVDSLELYLDTSGDLALIKSCTVQNIKFFAGDSPEWIEYPDREYSMSFLKTPFLSIICTEIWLEHERLSESTEIPMTIIYTYQGDEFGKVNYSYPFEKGTTTTLIDAGIYYSQFATKKYQAGTYTVTAYAFGEKVAEGKFTVVEK